MLEEAAIGRNEASVGGPPHVLKRMEKDVSIGSQNTFQPSEVAQKEHVLETRKASLKMQVRILVSDKDILAKKIIGWWPA
ncbi:MAG: hypothetical protein WD032_02975 [Nitrospirales bacterium]